ncbi:MAG: hypothetical protein M3132_10990 [Actinomycetia bacterium]|nr:hypothetical protein [Actinomycetes bacterium]
MPGFDMDPDRLIRINSVNVNNRHFAESDKQFAHGSRVGFHRDSPF